MATIRIERDDETIEVEVRRDGYGVIATEWPSRREWDLDPEEEDWAQMIIECELADRVPDWME